MQRKMADLDEFNSYFAIRAVQDLIRKWREWDEDTATEEDEEFEDGNRVLELIEAICEGR